ncbi:MAG: bifunctional acetate--CoA ligase family protein/GNAT family N-acetyltransferase [Ferrimicrobium sp.]
MTDPPNYPKMWESDTILSDGRTVHLRPIRPDDADGITRLHARLSPETIYYRFFTPLPKLQPAMLERFVTLDYVDRMALVAELREELIAVARYDRLTGTPTAEVAFLVDDAHQGRGMGTVMLEQLAAIAQTNGITSFLAETLPDNAKMLTVFQEAGYRVVRHFAEGVIEVHFDIEPTPESISRMHQREQRATARSVRALLAPSSVAVVGASRVPGSVGNLILANILDANFSGTVHPVNPNATAVRGVRAYPTISAIGEPIDLAILVVAAELVPAALADAAAAGVGAAVIISAGFSEASEEGRALEHEVVAFARANGMRVVGPNSMGVATPGQPTSLHATIAPFAPSSGCASVHAQSGPLSLAILAELARAGLGVSSFVSSGNKADISGNDLLAYWEDDPTTSVVLLYIEDFGNPRTFVHTARRVSEKKPIIAVKSKRRRDQVSPIDNANIDQDTLVEALFARTGVLRVDTLEQLVGLARAFCDQPLPAGNRVAILANAGGPAPLALDACRMAGLRLADLSAETIHWLSTNLPSEPRRSNPVELSPRVKPEEWGATLATLLQDSEVDAVLVLFVPTVVGTPSHPMLLAPPQIGERLRGIPASALDLAAQVANHIASSAAIGDKPVLANFLALPGVPPALSSGVRPIPSYSFPESAALALGRMWEYARWRQKPPGKPLPRPTYDRVAIRTFIHSALASPEPTTKLSPANTRELAHMAGLPLDPPPGARRQELDSRALLFCIEINHDRSFGPYITLGLSGMVSEILGLRTTHALPQTDLDLAAVIDAIPGIAMLHGYETIPALDRKPLIELLTTTCQLADDFYEIKRALLNHVSLSSAGVWVQELSVWIDPQSPTPNMYTRSLREPGSPSTLAR